MLEELTSKALALRQTNCPRFERSFIHVLKLKYVTTRYGQFLRRGFQSGKFVTLQAQVLRTIKCTLLLASAWLLREGVYDCYVFNECINYHSEGSCKKQVERFHPMVGKQATIVSLFHFSEMSSPAHCIFTKVDT